MAIGIIVLALTIAGASPGPQANTPTAIAAPQGVKEQPKLTCRRYAEMGSNIRRRNICLNKDQWDAMARQSQALGRSMQPALTVNPGGL